jgi:hypothetical protein
MTMRSLMNIVEGAAEDIIKSKRAYLAYRAFANYAIARDRADVEYHFSDGILYGFDTANFGGAEVFGQSPLVILIGVREGYRTTAEYSKMTGQVGAQYPHAIIMRSAREATVQAAIASIGSVEFLEVFKHEMVHCFDDAETSGKVLSTHKYGDRPSLDTYFNNPWEFNAFYHMIVANWANFVEESEGHDADYIRELADLFSITGDFKTDMEQAVSSQRRGRDFLKHLTDPRRKALLRRLYQMHQKVRAALDTPNPAQQAA